MFAESVRTSVRYPRSARPLGRAGVVGIFCSLLLPLLASAESAPKAVVDFNHGPLRVSDNKRFLVHGDIS